LSKPRTLSSSSLLCVRVCLLSRQHHPPCRPQLPPHPPSSSMATTTTSSVFISHHHLILSFAFPFFFIRSVPPKHSPPSFFLFFCFHPTSFPARTTTNHGQISSDPSSLNAIVAEWWRWLVLDDWERFAEMRDGGQRTVRESA